MSALNKTRDRPTVYEPRSFRARYPDDQVSSNRRGPLTYRQESDLRKGGVAVICGCNAAGLESVEEFVSQRIGRELFRQLPPFADVREFEQHLKAQRPARNGVTVYLVAAGVGLGHVLAGDRENAFWKKRPGGVRCGVEWRSLPRRNGSGGC